MPVIGTKAGYRGRAGLGGLARVKSHRGTLCVSGWPRHAKRRKSEAQSDSVRTFDAAAAMYAVISPDIKTQVRRATQGTQWLARDVHTVMMYGTFFALQFGPNEVIYPMAAQTEVSESLDILGQSVGSILIRTVDQWVILPPGTTGQVLEMQASGLPGWSTP